jgi:DNA repair photolyase
MWCLHGCFYCWSEALKKGRLKNTAKYRDLSEPKLIEKELTKTFKSSDFTFVEPMGDLFGEWVSEEMILKVLTFMHNHQGRWLLLTKNPKRMWKFEHHIPTRRTMIGITLETNRVTTAVSKAPIPLHRTLSFRNFTYYGKEVKRFVCIEPIMDFDLAEFVKLIAICDPEMVAVGYDNYNNRLPEPELGKTEDLIRHIELMGVQVVRKTLRERVVA